MSEQPSYGLMLSGALVCLAGCSGLLPSLPGAGPVVTPAYLARYAGGGSLSTLWYEGSDTKYHYFNHYVKVRTRYRIKRSDFIWKTEFPRSSREPALVQREFSDYRRH